MCIRDRLRSSLQVEKMETVPLKKELDIVKDYLALEQMRFEERLKVEMDIDEDTLEQPVPPMMLQTLVENAIKHGISNCLLYTSPSPRDRQKSRMPSSA